MKIANPPRARLIPNVAGQARLPEQQARLNEPVSMARKSPITLLYSARDEEHNQAPALSRALKDSPKT